MARAGTLIALAPRAAGGMHGTRYPCVGVGAGVDVGAGIDVGWGVGYVRIDLGWYSHRSMACDSRLAGRRLARSASKSGDDSSPLLLSLSPLSTPSIELAASITIPRALPPSPQVGLTSATRSPPNQPALAPAPIRGHGGTCSSVMSCAAWWNNHLSRFRRRWYHY